MPRRTNVRGHYRRVGGSRGGGGVLDALMGAGCLILIGLGLIIAILSVLEQNLWVVPIGSAIGGFIIYVRLVYKQRLYARYQAEFAQYQQQQLHELEMERQRQHAAWLNELARQRELGNLLVMSPGDFERFIAHLLTATGHTQVTHSGKSGDQGVDIHAVAPDGMTVIVQCKHYSPGNNVGGPAVQQFLGAILQHRAHRGLFVTTADYTAAAREAAQAHSLLTLMNGNDLVTWVRSVYQQQVAVPTPVLPPIPSQQQRYGQPF